MGTNFKISICVLLVILLTGCSETKKQDALESIDYKIANANGVSVQSVDDRHVMQAKDRFKIALVPAQGDAWNMESVSVLGVMFKNTGQTEMVLDLMLGNNGATEWSNSSLGRTIVKPGEQIPLSVSLCHANKNKTADPAYLKMSGRPNGYFRHWHTLVPKQVKSLVITCAQKGDHTFELAEMFPMQKINESLTGKFPFIDKYGQYIHKDWPDKVGSDKDLLKGIAVEKKLQQELGKPTGFSKYGGWKEGPKLKATGLFRTQKHKGRWWFVDPEGYLFWSLGVNCAGVEFASQTPLERNLSIFQNLPAKDDKEFGQFHTKLEVEENYKKLEDVPHYDFTRANLYRKYGKGWEQKQIAQDIKRLQYCNINTIGAWSDSELAAERKVPYTAMIHYEYSFAAEKLPDPFDPETVAGLRKAIEEYPVNFKNDPWCIGAFVNNELHWRNDNRVLVSAILSYEQESTAVKKFFKGWLEVKYNTVEAINKAWKTQFTSWDDLLKVNDESMFKDADKSDCSKLIKLFADTFFKMVKDELNDYSPNILYLGCRLHSGSNEVIAAAAKYSDVISTNVYWYRPHLSRFGNTDKPVLITEFHFANTGGNNLGSGLRSAQDAVQQGRLFSDYVAAAVDHPKIIGAHWFLWRDQNAAGRFDGENYDVGFFDVADNPNVDLIQAAEKSGRNLYNIIK